MFAILSSLQLKPTEIVLEPRSTAIGQACFLGSIGLILHLLRELYLGYIRCQNDLA